jgi:hypothetical protein
MTQRLFFLAFMAATLAISAPVHADRAATTNVQVESTKSVSEIAEYVDDVDRRFQKGRYDVAEKRDQKWMIQIIAALRTELESADRSRAPTPKLRALASEFETGIIGIEEGGIVCRQERKTGTRMSTQRCYSRKRLTDDTNKSQDQLRKMNRQPLTPTGQ